MKQIETEMTPRQRRLFLALLAGDGFGEACEAAGISRATGWRWMQQPTFRSALTQAEAEMISEAQRRLLNLQSMAISVLGKVAADPHLPPGPRLQAAKAILDAVLRFRDYTTFEARLSAIETKLDELTGKDNQNG